MFKTLLPGGGGLSAYVENMCIKGCFNPAVSNAMAGYLLTVCTHESMWFKATVIQRVSDPALPTSSPFAHVFLDNEIIVG